MDARIHEIHIDEVRRPAPIKAAPVYTRLAPRFLPFP